MPRQHVKKTNRAKTPRPVMEEAYKHVVGEKRSIRSVAQKFDIDRTTMRRYILNVKKDGIANTQVGYYGNRRIFNQEQEDSLENYLLSASNIYFGLTPAEVRSLAYECAINSDITIPQSWRDNKSAGVDWFNLFMKRHPNLSVRKPEATSLSRATRYNESNVNGFFSKLNDVMDRYKFEGKDIWNVDKTEVTTVQKPSNIVAAKGVKQVGALTSGERGTLVSVCGAVNAVGNAIPPMLVFPRKNFKSYFIRDGPPGCAGTANTSGWMTAENFLEFLQHFVQHAKPSSERPVLLLLDNYHAHIAVSILNYAKENGIVMLSFPPHCSHKLQPLDRSVFGLLKKYVSGSQDNWMRNHPGIPMTIYDIPSILKEAWLSAVTPKNVTRGFEVSGIYPVNPNVFDELDFAPSYVTDRPFIPDDDASKYEETAEGQTTDTSPIDDSVTQSNDKNSDTRVRQSVDLTADNSSTPLSEYLENKGLEMVEVRGDGHCLLYAFATSLHSEGISETDIYQICEGLQNEVRENGVFYGKFLEGSTDIVHDIDDYIINRQYNTDSGDVLLSALCNAFKVRAVIMRAGNDGSVIEINQNPRSPAIGTVKLVLIGSDAAAHYNAAVKKTVAVTEESTPVQATVSQSNPSTETSKTFDPEQVRPFPKAAPRKLTKRSKNRRRSAILTDTPEKHKLEEAEANRNVKRTKPSSMKKKAPAKKTKASRKKSVDLSDEEEWFCLICVEPYSNSKPREKWVQCLTCKEWAHEACTSGGAVYICQHCDSDDDL